MAFNTTAYYPDIPVETCSCSAVAHDLLLTYSDASKLTRGDLKCLFAGWEIISRTAASIDLPTNIQNPEFDAQLIDSGQGLSTLSKSWQLYSKKAQTGWWGTLNSRFMVVVIARSFCFLGKFFVIINLALTKSARKKSPVIACLHLHIGSLKFTN